MSITFEDVECLAETEEALLCLIEDEDVWLPKSHVHDDSEVYEHGHVGNLVITEWIASKKGLIREKH